MTQSLGRPGNRGGRWLVFALGLCCIAAAAYAQSASVLQSGDMLYVDVHRRPELTTTAQVNDSGYVPLPYIGKVSVAGLSESEAEARVTAAFRSILKNPRVTVSRSGAPAPMRPQAARTVDMKTQIISLNNSNAEVLCTALQGMSTNGGSITHDVDTNVLIITDMPGTIQNMMGVISQIDQMQSQITQVRIEATIAEVEDGAMSELGIKWFVKGDHASGGFYPFRGQNQALNSARGQSDPLANERLGGGYGGGTERRWVDETPYFDRRLNIPLQVPVTGEMFFGYMNSGIDVGALLSALASDGKAEVLANPRILTVNHKLAQIEMVDEIPFQEGSQTFGGSAYSVKFMDIGIKLDVTPHVYQDTAGTYVQMALHPEISYANGVANGVPIRSVRSSNTVANVRDGQTLVIGGIVLTDKHTTIQRVPGLGRIPLLGNLFKHKERSTSRNELMVFVTPTVHETPETITWDRMMDLPEDAQAVLGNVPANQMRGETRKE